MSVHEASRSPASRKSDGVKVVATGGVRKSVWLISGAVFLGSLALFVLFFARGPGPHGTPASPTPPTSGPSAPAAAVPEKREPTVQPSAPVARRDVHPVSRSKPASPDGAPPAHEDAPFSFGPPGEKTGIGLFPPRDTKPIKIGIVVPDDYEVPEGYVRHYQVGDDGQMLPAILMFHPDYQWVDADGHPIELPADRVVPPELAPPNLPIHMLEVPESAREQAH